MYNFVNLSAKCGGVGLDDVKAAENLVVGGDVSLGFSPVSNRFVD